MKTQLLNSLTDSGIEPMRVNKYAHATGSVNFGNNMRWQDEVDRANLHGKVGNSCGCQAVKLSEGGLSVASPEGNADVDVRRTQVPGPFLSIDEASFPELFESPQNRNPDLRDIPFPLDNSFHNA